MGSSVAGVLPHGNEHLQFLALRRPRNVSTLQRCAISHVPHHVGFLQFLALTPGKVCYTR
nr:MAG TPA: hypothetical protein [Caudoviricetes sp.]